MRSKFEIIFFFLSSYRRYYLGIFLVTIVTAVFESLNVAAFFPVFYFLLNSSEKASPGGVLGVVIKMIGFLPFRDPIVSASITLLTLMLLKSGLNLLQERLIAQISGKILYDVKNRLMDKYASSSCQFFLDNKQGSLIYNALNAPHKVAILLLRVPQLFAQLLKICAIMTLLVVSQPLATIFLMLPSFGYYWGTHYLSKKVSYNTGKSRANASAEQNIIANEFLSGIRQLMAFCTTGKWLKRFERENALFRDLYVKDLIWLAIPKNLMELVAISLMFGSLILLRINDPSHFSVYLPTIGVFAMALFQLLPSITSVGKERMEMMGALPDSELVYHALSAPTSKRKEGAKHLESFERSIIFNNVSFTHKGRGALLKHINVIFEKGQVTAICGPSGAGKTTLVNLILGLFEPTEGTILIDGIPLEEYKRETWLQKVGFVSQDPFIFHSTIADNIAFGRSRYTEEEIIEAARMANVHSFVSELPEGYQTLVGDRGMKLSGGQQQRIAIARAVLSHPQILIFDEATSSLDTVSERLVQESIGNLSKNHTVIVIAHRLSTIADASRIIVLENGRVVEEGHHTQLLSQGGQYSHMIAAGLR